MSVESDKMFLRAIWTWFTLTCVHCARVAWYIGIILFVLATVALTVFRYWLPALSERKAEIETFVSQQIGQQVTVGAMSADWRGLYPSLHIKDLTLHAEDGKDEKIGLEELSLSLDLVPLLQGRFVFRQVTLQKPRIEIVRTADGEIHIGHLPSLTRKDGKPDRNIFDILFQQRIVVIEDGIIEWRDELLEEPPLRLSDVNIGLESRKNHHVFDGTLSLQGDEPHVIVLAVDLDGNPLHDDDWNGKVDVRVSSLDIETLPGIIMDATGIPDLQGRLTVDLDTGWRDGVIDSATGKIEADDLNVSLGSFGTPLSISTLRSQLSLEHANASWELQLGNTWLALTGKPWQVGNVRLNYREDESSMQLERLELEKLQPVLDALASENKIVQLVKDLYPSGLARDTRLVLYGPLGEKPRDFLYEMVVSDTTVRAHKLYPAATGLSGSIRINKSGGLVDAIGKNSTVVLEKVFDAPLHVDQMKAKVTWEKGEKYWHIRNSDLWLENPDAEVAAQFHVKLPLDKTIMPTIELNAELRNGNLMHASRYFPVRLLGDGMNRWLAQTRMRGRASHARLTYQGAVHGFPIRGAEQLDVVAGLESASMNFLPGWPRVSGIEGDLIVSKTDLWLKGNATDLAGQRVDDTVVHLSRLDQPGQQAINVSTAMHGALQPVVEFLRTGPLFKDKPLQNLDLTGSGQGSMQLDVSVPLRQPEKNVVAGSYRLLQAGLQLPNRSRLTALKGKINFTDKSVAASGISGKFLGGPVSIDINTIKPGRPPEVEIQASGEVQADQLAPVTGDWLAAGLAGSTAWQGLMRFGAGDPSLQVTTSMKGINGRFPAPLDKAADADWPLQLDAVFPAGGSTRVSFSVGDVANGTLLLSGAQREGPEIGGCVRIGADGSQCPPAAGLSVALVQPFLETAPWLDYFTRGEEGDGDWPPFLARVTARIDSLDVSGVDMQDIDVKLDRQPDGAVRGSVTGSLINGEVAMRLARDKRSISAQLERLVWNEAQPGHPVTTGKASPLTFPRLDLAVNDLVFHGRQLGRFTLKGAPTLQGWGLESMQLQRPDMTVKVNGRWRGSLLNHSSSFDVDFTSSDMLATLKALGVNTEMASKDFHVGGYLSWADTPFDFSFDRLDGVLDIHSGKGSLKSVEVGAGRLIGVLNVNALTRRLQLDFSDLFEKGFAFDKIDSQMEIKLGQANVTRFIMSGPSATIRMEGRLGLVDEDIDMKMAISPAVGGSLTVAGFALGGPVAGVATYVAQKAIQKQMNKATNYKYHVSGSWQDPEVTKLAGPERKQRDAKKPVVIDE